MDMRSLITICEGIPRDDQKRSTTLSLSDHDIVDVMGEWDRHETDTDASPQRVLVDPSRLRATQDWVDTRWAPGTHTRGESAADSDPWGIRTPDGLVHLGDGHHRGEHALANGTPIHVSIYDSPDVPPRKFYNQRDQRERDERRIANNAVRKARGG